MLIVGAVYSESRLVGVLSNQVEHDGDDSTTVITAMIRESRFARQIQAVLLQGIAMAGFNVIDIHALHEALSAPVLVIARHMPDMQAIRNALFSKVKNGQGKWALIEKAGPMQSAEKVYVQRAGIALTDARNLIERLAINGSIPEPLRSAHIIAGGIVRGESRGRT